MFLSDLLRVGPARRGRDRRSFATEQAWESGEIPFENKCVSQFADFYDNYFGKTRELIIISGAVQAGFLTYRRIAEIDPWLSTNFDMDAIRDSLDKGEVPMIRFFENDMIHPACGCGRFDAENPVGPSAQEITKDQFSNLEDWSRTTFIPPGGD